MRIELEGGGFHDSLVKDKAVLFGTWSDLEAFGGRVAGEEVRIDHIDVSSVIPQRVENLF